MCVLYAQRRSGGKGTEGNSEDKKPEATERRIVLSSPTETPPKRAAFLFLD